MKKLSIQLLSDVILEKRKNRNISQEQLSKLTGINRLMIGRIEKKEYIPSIEQLQALAEALQFDITTLFVEEHSFNGSSSANSKRYNIAVAGTGYVGLSIATLLAQHHHVTAVDIIPEKVDMLNHRQSPIQDEYIEKYLAEKPLDLTATLDGESAYRDADYVIIAAPTNYDSKKNFFDCSAVEAVIELVLKVNSKATMVIKSTIPVAIPRRSVKNTIQKILSSVLNFCANPRHYMTISIPAVSLSPAMIAPKKLHIPLLPFCNKVP